MKLKKIKRVVASVAFLTCIMSQTIVYAATNQSTEASTEKKSSIDDQEGIVKVNIDESGDVTYTEPQGASIHDEPSENSPFSWDNALVYFVLTDRFKNGDTSNDNSYGRGLNQAGTGAQTGLDYKTNPGTFHGGDLKGLTEKVTDGYFTKLGVNAIWITAPYEQMHGYTSGNQDGDAAMESNGKGFPYYAYHGYWTLDYSNIDKNMGTEKDLETFVDSCHERGIRVVMDVVLNHTGYISIKDCIDLGMNDALGKGAIDYYYGDVNQLTGGLAESQNWYNLDSDDWASKWWGTNFVRVSSDYKGYKNVGKSAGLTSTLCGLPDIYTEATAEVPLPGNLQTLWKQEGRYEKETAELDKFFTSTGLSRTPRNYVIKWLTDWVRDYGIDGYRCDTAAHVEKEGWGALKKNAVAALKEWRQNHPDKPGAKWTDDFWMVGESWGHGVGADDYYTTGGFDSMVNFTFPKDASLSGLDGLYSGYASQINSKENFNALSYIASHDDNAGMGVFSSTTEQMIDQGTKLILTPGGAQIYYGNETRRGIDWTFFTSEYKDQRYRSDMNWDTADQKVLAHWQKLGSFRYNHLSIGGGEHIKIADAPYTFGRVYNNAEKGSDRVVVSLPGKAGSCEVSVEGVFSDGAKLRDAYTDKMYTVSGGKVSVEAGENGVVLLEKGDKSPDVGVSPASKSYYTDSLTLSLSVTNNAPATYSIDGGAQKTFVNGDKITIGAGLDYGTTTTVTVYAKNSDGEAGPSTYTYTKKDPMDMRVVVHAKNSKWASAPNIYVYNEEGANVTKYAGAWPGVAMEPDTEKGDGWYKYELYGETGSARVIFNGSFGQDPSGTTSPGYLVTDEMDYNEGVWSQSPVEQAPTISSLTSNPASPQAPNTPVTFTTAATGGTGSLQYQYEVNGVVKQAYSSNKTFSWISNVNGDYTIKVTVKDENGKTASKQVSYSLVLDTVLSLKSFTTSVASNQKLGTTITLNANAVGSGSVKYRFTASLNGVVKNQSNWLSSSSYAWKPTVAGNYAIKVEATDDTGSIVNSSKSFVIIDVNKLSVALKTSVATPQYIGTAITLGAAATGSTGTVKYRFSVLLNGKLKAQSSASTAKTYTWKPTVTGNYVIRVEATDATGTIAQSSSNYLINYPPYRISSFATNVQSPQAVGTSIIMKSAVSGSTGTVKYRYTVSLNGVIKAQSSVSTASTYTWKPTVAGKYVIKAQCMDSTGKVVAFSKNYSIVNVLTLKSLSANVASPQALGTSIKLGAAATGNGTIKYKYDVYLNGTLTAQSSASTTNTFTWKPTKVGAYSIKVSATDSSAKVVSKTMTYNIVAANAINVTSMTTNVQSPQSAGTKITINTKATSSSTLYYKYWVNFNGEWKLLRDYSTTSSVSWTPSSSGSYIIWVDIKNAAGKTAYKFIDYEVIGKTVTYQENSSKLKFAGSWQTQSSSNFSGGQAKIGASNAKCQLTFTGTGLTIYATKGANYGYVKVTIDGVAKAIDLYSSTTKYAQAIYSNESLANKSHTVLIEYTGMQNVNSNGSYISLDAIRTIE